jgi:hypothetical protein
MTPACAACAEKRAAMLDHIDETLSHARQFEAFFNDPNEGGRDPEGNADLIDALHGWIAELEQLRQITRSHADKD